MSKEGMSKLFIDFNKLDENSHRNKQGTGLGLSICKRIIEQMGGSVRVESEINVGTSFIFTLKTKCLMAVQKDQIWQSPYVFIEKGCHNLELSADNNIVPDNEFRSRNDRLPSKYLEKLERLLDAPLIFGNHSEEQIE
jgi:hypothetical protein